MRVYTTASFFLVVGMFSLIAIVRAEGPGLTWLYAVAGAVTVDYSRHWEKAPAWWSTAGALVVSLWVWTYAAIILDVWGMVFAAVVLAVIVGRQSRWLRAAILGLAVMLAPIGIAAIVAPRDELIPLASTAVLMFAATTFAFLLNRYGFGLYLEIDAARRVSADLAVAEERYRFAADLHDIQGHTLHVLRLKIQLADRLIDRDPDAAHTHLAEAQMLIAETVANTRSLAFGDRHVAVASELANARELFGAAGIDCVVHGEVSTHGQEELFGLVVREVTTNILRHSQATAVTVRLGDGLVVITNDGSPEGDVKLSGLARLSDRFAAAGGTLTASTHGGRFTTEALIPNAAILSSTGSRGRAAL